MGAFPPRRACVTFGTFDAELRFLALSELSWIERASGAPYFVTSSGAPWTPIGQNDAITWPELAGLFRRRDLPAVERHLVYLRDSGVTCLRLMLEYAQTNHRYFERPAGCFVPAMVQLWDDLFALCIKVGLRVLLTPLDTFFTWVRWKNHPYNQANGGPCADRSQLMVCPETRKLVKGRLAFATERWGSSGVIFAWDLWNEMHPAQGDNRPDAFTDFIDDVSPFLRDLETRLHGRAHLQCVSVFGPELIWKPWIVEPIFRHPQLDFANSHFYEEGTIDDPRDTLAPAVSAGRLTREALAEITDLRPFFDSEHGPIHTFKDKHRTLPEAFDDEYFRHIQWAHLASGGAGGGMRWPNRSPHVLTAGMRRAQKAMADFLPLMDWKNFRRRNLNDEIVVCEGKVQAFGCGDERQALLWLVRRRLRKTEAGLRQVDGDGEMAVTLRVPGLLPGTYQAVCWDTRAGQERQRLHAMADETGLNLSLNLAGPDIAIAINKRQD
jgi:mannan endo-1,4-beta-mannosidase